MSTVAGCSSEMFRKLELDERSQDGGGLGRGDHSPLQIHRKGN